MKKFIFTLKAKVFCISALILFITNERLQSQRLPSKIVDKLSVDNLKNDLEEPVYKLDDVTKYRPKEEAVKSKTLIENVVVVRYESYAKISVLLHESTTENLLFLKNKKTDEIMYGQLLDKEIIFSNVKLDNEYEVIEKENMRKELKIGDVSSLYKKKDMVALSDVLFNKLNAYSISPENLPFRTFLANLNECSYLERLAFYQRHVLKSKKISDKLVEGEFPIIEFSNDNSLTSESSSISCNCTYVVKALRDFAPGFPTNWPNGNIYGDFSNGWINEEYSNKAWANSGAAKWQQLQSGSGFASGNYSWQNGAEGSAGTPFYASIGYNLFCTNNPTQVPSACECDKGLPITAKYNTKLNTSTNTDGCFWCWGNRGARAAAEDWAIVVEHNIKTGEITPLSGGNAVSISECSSTFNTDFLVQLGNVAINVFAVSQKSEPLSGPLNNLNNLQKQQKVNSLVNSITQLLNTPIVNRTPCGSDEKTLSLVNYAGWRILKANTPTIYTIYSASALRSGGFTKWSSDSRIISQFMLGGIIQGGTNPGQEFCCSAPIANWVSFTTPDLPSNRFNLQNMLGFYWYGGNAPIVNTDFGVKEGNPPSNCVRLDGLRQNSGLTIRQSQDGIYLNNLKDEVVECTISDILGKIVGYYKGESSNKKIWDYANTTTDSGVYIIKVSGKDGM